MSDERVLRLRWPGSCKICGAIVEAGTCAAYRRTDKTIRCLTCASPGTIETGSAGASAQREFERRIKRRNDEKAALRERHPILGRLKIALRDTTQQETAWLIGADGERHVAAELARLCTRGPIRWLADRRLPGLKANIDLLAVGPGGVTVIDAKNYRGAVRVRGGGLVAGRPVITVDGRGRPHLLESIHRQHDVVLEALATAGEPVTSVETALCFWDPDLPFLNTLLGKALKVDGVHMGGPRMTAPIVQRVGELDGDGIERIAAALARELPPA